MAPEADAPRTQEEVPAVAIQTAEGEGSEVGILTAQGEVPGENVEGLPHDNAEDNPDEDASDVPEQQAEANPDEGAPGVPGDQTEANPDEVAADIPEQQTEDNPDDGASNISGGEAGGVPASSAHNPRRARTVKDRNAWDKFLDKFTVRGNTGGRITEYLKRRGHNCRPSMSPEERRQLMADLVQGTEVRQPDGQEEIYDNTHSERCFMATSFALVDSLSDSAKFLSIDLSDWENINISSFSDLTLRADQVQNIAYMVKNAEGILKGAINANDSGTGKTIEALASVFFLVQRREANTGFAEHRATLILCPHQALRGWQEAHSKFFSNLLTLHVCSKSFSKNIHGEIIDPDVTSFTTLLESMEPSDPRTSYRIIISTNEEFSSKAFLKERKKEYILGKRGFSVSGSKLAAEAHEAITVGRKPVLFDLEFKTDTLKRIGTLIADEAHEMKDPRTRRAQAAYLVDTDITFLLTASPTVNKISDFHGLLFALFKPKEWRID